MKDVGLGRPVTSAAEAPAGKPAGPALSQPAEPGRPPYCDDLRGKWKAGGQYFARLAGQAGRAVRGGRTILFYDGQEAREAAMPIHDWSLPHGKPLTCASYIGAPVPEA